MTLNNRALSEGQTFDAAIIGAGPGGLQAAIYLGRYNRNVLLVDRGGGRTAHAKSIENFLTQKAITGKRIIELGMEQAQSFHARIERGTVRSVRKQQVFEVETADVTWRSRFVIVSTGVYDVLPPLENLPRFFGSSFFTCIDCDGYKTTGKKVVVMGDNPEVMRLALGMHELFTRDLVLVLTGYDPPQDYQEELRDRGISVYKGEGSKIIGEDRMEALELRDGTRIPCEMIMAGFGFKMNDEFLKDLDLKRSANGSIVVNSTYESSVAGLYVLGPLNTGNDQAVIAAGQGAVAAIAINKRMFEF